MEKYLHDGELIQEGVMDFESGWEEPVLLLRWRFRVCSACTKQFDITKEGRFYECGECV